MCGLTGFYIAQPDHTRSDLRMIGKNMNEALRHRGPDASGLWQDSDLALLLAHRRLSILDLSPEGAQPMHSAPERYVIVYNGEIYNFPALKKQLEAAGLVFRGRSDTEVLLASIEHWGLNQALQKIRGMFAFVLWDRQSRTLHFARDRLGKKPLYIGWAGKGAKAALVFSSELKALCAHPQFTPRINQGALSQFMNASYVQAPHCIYEGVWSLPAGFRLSLPLDSLKSGENLYEKMQPHWHHLRALEESQQNIAQKPERETIDEFEALLRDCVAERMVSDVPLGAFLSGGIDSSAIIALMQEQSPRPVKTYTIGFKDKGFDEAAYAAKIASHLGTDHHELYVSPNDARDVIPQLPDIYDEPFADISAIPTYLVSKFAKQSVSVALSGDGGDEMLGGYNRHISAPKIWNRTRMMPHFLRQAIKKGAHSISPARWDKMMPQKPQFGSHIYKAASILSLNSQEAIYDRLLAQWVEPPLLNHSTLNHSAMKELRHTPEWEMSGSDFAKKMMYWDALSYLPNDILTKVDRASMAVSLETRAPLLDRRIYDYAWRLPAHYKIRDGQGKWILRQMLARHVPTEFFERPKQGFSMPIGAWLRGDLKDWAEDLLSAESLSEGDLLSPAPIRKIWEAHKQGQGNHAGQLWNILMFQSWKRRWL